MEEKEADKKNEPVMKAGPVPPNFASPDGKASLGKPSAPKLPTRPVAPTPKKPEAKKEVKIPVVPQSGVILNPNSRVRKPEPAPKKPIEKPKKQAVKKQIPPASLPPTKPVDEVKPETDKEIQIPDIDVDFDPKEAEISTMQDDIKNASREASNRTQPPNREASQESQQKKIDTVRAVPLSIKQKPLTMVPTKPPSDAHDPYGHEVHPEKTATTPAPLPHTPAKIVQPGKPKKKRRWAVLLGLALLLTAIGAGGAAGWYWFSMQQGDSKTDTTGSPNDLPVVAEAGDILPGNALLVIHYQFSNDELRTRIRELWSGGSLSPTEEDLLAGDPRILLEEEGLMDAYYVFLGADSGPYLVIQKAGTLDSLLAQGGSVIERDGWLIAHRSDVQPYLAALAISTGLPPQFHTEGAAIEIAGNAGWLEKTREQILGDRFERGVWEGLYLDGVVLPSGDLSLSGTVDVPVQDTPAQTSLELLTSVPDDATFVRLGSDFAEEVVLARERYSWLNPSVLVQPAVASLIAELNVPFAYYQRIGEDAEPDFGFVLALPDELVGSLAVGDETIEAGLLTLAPALTGKLETVNTAWTDSTHNEIALRYINFVPNTAALDYALHEGRLLIATSREGMLRSLDVAAGIAPPYAPVELERVGRDALFGQLPDALAAYMPVSKYSLTVQPDEENGETRIIGILKGTIQQQPIESELVPEEPTPEAPTLDDIDDDLEALETLELEADAEIEPF